MIKYTYLHVHLISGYCDASLQIRSAVFISRHAGLTQHGKKLHVILQYTRLEAWNVAKLGALSLVRMTNS